MVSSKAQAMGMALPPSAAQPWRAPSQLCGHWDTSVSPLHVAWCNTSLGHRSRVATMGWHCAGDKQPGFSSGAASFSMSLRVPIPLHHTNSPLGRSSPVSTPDGPAAAHKSLLFPFQGFLGDPGPAGEKGEKGAKVRVSVLALRSPAWVGQGVAPSLPRPPSPRSCSLPSLRLLLAFPGGEGRKWPARSCWASRELTGKAGLSHPAVLGLFLPSIPFPGPTPLLLHNGPELHPWLQPTFSWLWAKPSWSLCFPRSSCKGRDKGCRHLGVSTSGRAPR